jgi:hypothetical protein
MHEDYVDFGIGMRVYLGDLKAFDIVKIDSGALIARRRQPRLSCTVLCTNRDCMALPCLCAVLLAVYRIRCIRPGSGYGSGSLYTTAASPSLCVMTEDTPGR